MTRSLRSWQRATRRTSLSVGTASVHQVPLALSSDDRRGTICGRSSICGFRSDKLPLGMLLQANGSSLHTSRLAPRYANLRLALPRPARLLGHVSARACPPLADATGAAPRFLEASNPFFDRSIASFATNITRTVHQWHCAHRSRQVRERMMYASTRESCKKELGAALWVGDYFASEKHEVPLRPTNLLTLATTHDARAHTHLPSFLDAHLRRPPARRPVPVRSNL